MLRSNQPSLVWLVSRSAAGQGQASLDAALARASLQMTGWTLSRPWGVGKAKLLRRVEGSPPPGTGSPGAGRATSGGAPGRACAPRRPWAPAWPGRSWAGRAASPRTRFRRPPSVPKSHAMPRRRASPGAARLDPRSSRPRTELSGHRSRVATPGRGSCRACSSASDRAHISSSMPGRRRPDSKLGWIITTSRVRSGPRGSRCQAPPRRQAGRQQAAGASSARPGRPSDEPGGQSRRSAAPDEGRAGPPW